MNNQAISALDGLYAKYITDACSTGYSSVDHYHADAIIKELLSEVGLYKVVDAFDDVEKKYA